MELGAGKAGGDVVEGARALLWTGGVGSLFGEEIGDDA
jgi:hypothetical protein